MALESKGEPKQLAAFGKQLAMHIAAANPQAVDVESLGKDVVAREQAVLTEQAKESGKPAPVIEKMVEGRMRKFYEDVVLLAQAFVHDPETKVVKRRGRRREGGRRPDQDHRLPSLRARRRDRSRGRRGGLRMGKR